MASTPHLARALSDDHISAISIIERTGSVFSILGCIFIIVTFSISKAFHKPINRLVFYASFGNLMTNIATLMARDFLANLDSVGCQLQAFLIQMFMPADAFWTLAMAFNVYLTFYHKFDSVRLRKMEIWYFLACYGLPFVPAIVFIFVSDYSNTANPKGRMYGDASLWCWVSAKWDVFRIATFYVPVWIVILVTFFIYIRAGRDIYNKRRQLRYFSSSHELTMDDPFSVKTTEVVVTTEESTGRENGIALDALDRSKTEAGPSQPVAGGAYSITISSNARQDRDAPAQNVQIREPQTARPGRQRRRANMEANTAAWSYARCAILFFTALLITWIPSSANRVYSVVHGGEVSTVLQFMSALVLPLQGFWNAVIYISTSWSACEYFFSELRHRTKRPATSTMLTGDANHTRNTAFRIAPIRQKSNYDTESMTELASQTRASSEDGIKSSS